ncbi:UDP-N-acetylmuramate--alanine ligase [Halobacteroides halobius DSM 5150]|uniref:UDP-N-acetylmuramate--L-alanine ligase n=1 Tax=Halobacteroides halobius (strain ATCC 35273 / DSM 5150 / MD-1) TaxID=748449 RepID=L0K8R0_HALHC|nr:UDP-N-acetylmuramate--L-alanine ligase [Halobacteroides halobius]AGB41391.1 UDP-N-acetylmuramate--alanine ligase [Halobacteroides halobius DSM 5150]
MKKVHIIGIGGIAMSAIAQYFLTIGYQVTGSDLENNELIEELKNKGAQIKIGHQADNIDSNLEKVIYSDAIPDENVELKQAREYGIELLGRSQALALITANKKVISASGTHGKTTTSGLLAQILTGGQKNPSFIIGGILNNFNSNFMIKESDYFILEGDEYGKSFLKYPSDIGVVTNIEFDHPDIYRDLDDMVATYKEYVAGLSECLVTNNKVLAQLEIESTSLPIEVLTVGINDQQADFNAVKITEVELESYFILEYQGQEIGQFRLPALGDYNIRHALEAIAVGKYCGLSFETMKESLGQWQGVKRRFEVLSDDDNQIIITDYAHHPSEVKAVVDNLDRIETDKQKVVIFQPHQYLRTNSLLKDYQKVLNQNLDERVIYQIYKVRERVEEKELERLGKRLSQLVSDQPVTYINQWSNLEEWLTKYNYSNDAIYLFLGAGDIDQFARKWAKKS